MPVRAAVLSSDRNPPPLGDPPPGNPPPLMGGGGVTWPKKQGKHQAPKAPKKFFYKAPKLIYTVILWYSFVPSEHDHTKQHPPRST